MYGGTFIRLLLFISLLGLIAGLLIPIVLEELLEVDEYKAQKRAETVVRQAAKWYVINNGPPTQTMRTTEVKKVLIPNYLNKWPGKEPIECEIDPNGEIRVKTLNRVENRSWILEIIQERDGVP